MRNLFFFIICIMGYLSSESVVSEGNKTTGCEHQQQKAHSASTIIKRLSTENWPIFSDNIINSPVLNRLKTDLNNDTIFIKIEQHFSEILPPDFWILIWNNSGSVYLDSCGYDLFALKPSLYQRLREDKRTFFELVEKWDTAGMRKMETHRFSEGQINSELIRVICDSGEIRIDTFEFSELDIPVNNLPFTIGYNRLYSDYSSELSLLEKLEEDSITNRILPCLP